MTSIITAFSLLFSISSSYWMTGIILNDSFTSRVSFDFLNISRVKELLGKNNVTVFPNVIVSQNWACSIIHVMLVPLIKSGHPDTFWGNCGGTLFITVTNCKPTFAISVPRYWHTAFGTWWKLDGIKYFDSFSFFLKKGKLVYLQPIDFCF